MTNYTRLKSTLYDKKNTKSEDYPTLFILGCHKKINLCN